MPITTIGSDLIQAGVSLTSPIISGTAFANNMQVANLYGNQNPVIANNTIIQSDLQLTGSIADGFPNITGLEIFNFANSASGDEVGLFGHTLTLAGANASIVSLDVLGVSRYNTCGADTQWRSTSTDFNIANTADIDDFMVGGWIYIPDTTPADTVVLFGNTTDRNLQGYNVELRADGILWSYLYGGTAKAITIDISSVSVGYHHIFQVREVGVAQYLFLDGVLASTAEDTTIGTTQSKFQLSGYNHTATNVCTTGTRFDEFIFKKGKLPTNFADVIRNIYARSSKKFIIKDNNLSVYALDNNLLKLSSGVYLPTIVNGANVASSGGFSAATWIRIGDIVSVNGVGTIDPTSATADTAFTISLPIASNLLLADLNGVITGVNGSQFCSGWIRGGVANVATIGCTFGTTANCQVAYQFSYIIK